LPGRKSNPLQVRLTAKARRDLLDIWLGIATRAPVAADRVYDRIEAHIGLLRDFPEAGVARTELAPEAKMLVERPYLIFYRAQPNLIQIVRVLHDARHIDSGLIDVGAK
jgi:toxin ParE1/3/4